MHHIRFSTVVIIIKRKAFYSELCASVRCHLLVLFQLCKLFDLLLIRIVIVNVSSLLSIWGWLQLQRWRSSFINCNFIQCDLIKMFYLLNFKLGFFFSLSISLSIHERIQSHISRLIFELRFVALLFDFHFCNSNTTM